MEINVCIIDTKIFCGDYEINNAAYFANVLKVSARDILKETNFLIDNIDRIELDDRITVNYNIHTFGHQTGINIASAISAMANQPSAHFISHHHDLSLGSNKCGGLFYYLRLAREINKCVISHTGIWFLVSFCDITGKFDRFLLRRLIGLKNKFGATLTLHSTSGDIVSENLLQNPDDIVLQSKIEHQ